MERRSDAGRLRNMTVMIHLWMIPKWCGRSRLLPARTGSLFTVGHWFRKEKRSRWNGMSTHYPLTTYLLIICSADGTIKRGRGRGRGTGRSRTVTSHPHVPIAAAVPVSQDTGLPLRGPGSRGGTSRRPRGNKKADGGSDRAATTASAAHESRGGRGGGTGTSNRGGTNSNRGGKSSISIPMPDLAPAPSTQGVAHGPPAPNPLAGPELMMK